MRDKPEIKTYAARPYAAIAADADMAGMVDLLPQLWPETAAWLAAHDLAPAEAPFIRYESIGADGAKRRVARAEFYVTDPQSVPDPAQWQTVIEYKTS